MEHRLPAIPTNFVGGIGLDATFRRDLSAIRSDAANLCERMARLEGVIEGAIHRGSPPNSE